MKFNELFAAIETMSLSLESLSFHALNAVKEKNSMDDHELLLFTFLPAFNLGGITPSALNALFPYTSQNLIKEHLAHFEKNKLLLPTKENHFALTREGDSMALWITKEVNNALAGVLPLPATSMMDMASQMKEIADGCYAATEPPAKLQLTMERKLTPAGTIPMMARISQIARELIAYRLDAHQTAWRAYGVDGHTWEILTTLWQAKKMTAGELQKTLAYRGFTLDETMASISELARRGWVAYSKDEVSITPFGAEVRKIAEATTDRYYFAPWQKFTEARVAALRALVDEFRRNIPAVEA